MTSSQRRQAITTRTSFPLIHLRSSSTLITVTRSQQSSITSKLPNSHKKNSNKHNNTNLNSYNKSKHKRSSLKAHHNRNQLRFYRPKRNTKIKLSWKNLSRLKYLKRKSIRRWNSKIWGISSLKTTNTIRPFKSTLRDSKCFSLSNSMELHKLNVKKWQK